MKMAFNNRQRFTPKPKCNQCGSENLKKRKNFFHGSGSSGKISYQCKDCGSSDVKIPQQGRFRR